jgi:hypothetical protein
MVVKSQEKVKLVGDKHSSLVVAHEGGECHVLVCGTKTNAVATSDCWLLKVGIKI